MYGGVDMAIFPKGPRIHDIEIAMILLVLRSWFLKYCSLLKKKIRAHVKDGEFQGWDNERTRNILWF